MSLALFIVMFIAPALGQAQCVPKLGITLLSDGTWFSQFIVMFIAPVLEEAQCVLTLGCTLQGDSTGTIHCHVHRSCSGSGPVCAHKGKHSAEGYHLTLFIFMCIAPALDQAQCVLTLGSILQKDGPGRVR